MKKVLLFLIDSMMPDVLEQSVAEEKARAFRFFMERGQYINDCVTVFPTMTASIDCSLITGVYPDEHKVPGLIWYDPVEKKIINYLNGALPVLQTGIEHCARNVLFDLNERHLSKDVKTIHEEIEERGRTSGSINVIAHRGHKEHRVELPFLLDAVMGFRMSEKVSGPTIFSLGTLVKPAIFRPVTWNWSQSPLASYGLNDPYAIDVLIEVVKSGKQPDFTLIYLPDNDHKLHKTPHLAVEHLSQVDAQIVRFLRTFDSWEQALEQNIFLFISDHGQTVIGPGPEHNIPLEELLSGFTILKLGDTVQEDVEVVICNNERMSYLYPVADGVLPKLVKAVEGDERIDLIAWKEAEWVRVKQGGTERTLSFRKGGDRRDCYRNEWTIKGDWRVLDLKESEGGGVDYGDYPDALSRLYGALFSQAIQVVVVTAAPGFEFLSACSPTHLGGGSHGSLHKRDSLVPLLIAGASRPMPYPARIVDVKGFILQELALHATVV
ncbi:alkaline phosphatase family protein [Brevibacillus massiliensis]|jgi:predicted AlkP superfamily pyrophosphatase or phosphodiesterase|uniref:alkaline phosphatase family protein n=1 Tax=Brevibacillus massiliensis TaxID=1118054 RepID=UPI00030DBE64|nr:alkaline phosphatase family protein [Brevibacillus massiliensis]